VLSSSIIIPTNNRLQELSNALRSILIQTRLPQEVVLVDDGNLGEFPLKQLFENAGIRTFYHRKSAPGLPESRNAGVKFSKGDVILFLDDDVVLFPSYVEEILRVFESDRTGVIGGIGGSEANLIKPLSWRNRLRRLRDIVCLMGGFKEGRVLPSGYCTEYGSTGSPIKKVTEVDFLVGATSAYRRSVFQEFLFTENYRELGEDKDFSYRVSRKYRLLVNPDALLFHFESPQGRGNRRDRGRRGILGRYIFFRRYLLASRYRWVFFYYALFGHIASRALMALISRDSGDREQLMGMLDATRDILSGSIRLPGDWFS